RSVSSTVRPNPSSCSARTLARSIGPFSSAAWPRRESLKKFPRSAPAALSSTSVLSLVPPGRPSAPSVTRSPRPVLLLVRPLSAMARRRRRLRRPRRRPIRPRAPRVLPVARPSTPSKVPRVPRSPLPTPLA
ncbi:hypothetical protein BGZ65_006192, partial [Modicella reniformis]